MAKKSQRKRQPAHKTNVAPPARVRLWQSPLFWVATLVVVGGITAAGLLARNDSSSPGPDSTETAFAEIIGSPLPSFSTPDTAIGTAAPAISAQTLNGDRTIVGNDGKARLFGFFAHWCPHCRAEVPEVVAWLGANNLPSGVEVVAVSTAVNPSGANYPPSDWFAREAWPAQVLLDDANSTLATAFGLTAFPYWVAVDQQGVVVARTSGGGGGDGLAALIASITP